MTQQIVPFLFEGEAMVRVLDREGAPWFVAADVCRALHIQQSTRAVEPLDEDEKGVSSIHTPGGQQEVLVVSEGGLYTIILRSRDATKPGTVAHRFRKWVTGEVLPALRTNGTYTMTAPLTEREIPTELRVKPYWEWTLEEIRTHIAVANGYRHTFNNASAGWYLMAAGFPRPPERLMPAWWQSDMDLTRRRDDGREMVVVTVAGGRA